MTDVDVSAVRAAIKRTLSSVIPAVDLSDSVDPPCAMVYPESGFNYEMDFDRKVYPRFTILVLVPYVDTMGAQALLDTYISTEGPASISLAFVNDPTLAGAVSDAGIVEIKSYGVTSLHDGGTRYLHAELALEVIE